MAVRKDSYLDFVRDQLTGLTACLARPMFGGWGLYSGRAFFGIVFKGRLYFKVDPASEPKYKAAGMKPFRPNAKQKLMSFYEVPLDVLEDKAQAVDWARRAVAAAMGKGGV